MIRPDLSISCRTRSTPFTERVTEAGVKGYTVYNHMLLPTYFESLIADYHHLKQHVQVWDVACERQVEVTGPDAQALIQLITPRDLRKMKDDQCYYIPVVDDRGGMLNDPVTVKHRDDRWWISIADSDLLYWVKGLAIGRGMKVDIFEPDVSPLAVQGPKSDDLMAKILGEDIRSLGFFRHRRCKFGDQELLVARSGYSKQGGFEIYVDGSEHGEMVWDMLFEAGADLDVRAGCPNLIERIEGGLLSYGNDMTIANTPLECGLGRFCHSAAMESCIGGDVLAAQKATGPDRIIRSLKIDGAITMHCRTLWPLTSVAGDPAGQVSSCTYSPDVDANVAIGMVERAYWEAGTKLIAQTPNGPRDVEVFIEPFI